jgi:hypothetical protein
MIEQVKQSDPGVMNARREKDEPPAVERRALPTPERIRRAGADFDLGDTGQITMRDSPLERARARKLITHQQYSVGQKYRHHWYHAGLADQLQSIDVERIFAADRTNFSGMARTEAQVFHRQRYREATQAVARSGRMCSTGWCAGKLRSIRSAIRWAGAAVRRPMPRQSSG